MSDEIFGTGGNPVSSFIHGVYRDDSDPADNQSRMVQTDEEGSLIVTWPAALPVEVTNFPDPQNVNITGQDVPVEVTWDDPLPVTIDNFPEVQAITETLYSSWGVEQYDVPYSGVATGTATGIATTTTGGFVVHAPDTNIGNIMIGSAANKCFIKLAAGDIKSFAYPSPSILYWYGTADNANADPDPLPADRVVIEFFNPVP